MPHETRQAPYGAEAFWHMPDLRLAFLSVEAEAANQAAKSRSLLSFVLQSIVMVEKLDRSLGTAVQQKGESVELCLEGGGRVKEW